MQFVFLCETPKPPFVVDMAIIISEVSVFLILFRIGKDNYIFLMQAEFY